MEIAEEPMMVVEMRSKAILAALPRCLGFFSIYVKFGIVPPLFENDP
jgi:hypothetical protein